MPGYFEDKGTPTVSDIHPLLLITDDPKPNSISYNLISYNGRFSGIILRISYVYNGKP